MRLLPVLVLAALALPLAGCGPKECEDGQTRSCYTGDKAALDKGVCREGLNVCRDGAWSKECQGEALPTTETCDTLDNDCDGDVDEEVRNGCGGCETLEAKPGDACTGCGRWACDGSEKLKCVPPSNVPETECDKDGCPGTWKCGASGSPECRALRKNECGTCGGPTLTGLGDTCVGENGCDGAIVCNALGNGTVCKATARNNCGVCGAENVPDIDGACNGAGGCEGVYICTDDGLDRECSSPVKNECGACGGPALPNKGKACGGTGACAGSLTCNAAGDALSCVLGAAAACTGTSGCPGQITCDADNNPTVCVAPEKNACGTCGGPAVTGLGDACTVFEGCAGTKACNTAGDAAICKPVQTCTRITDHVVISEVSGAKGSDSENDFVELYNPTSADVDVGNWRVWYKPASDSPTTSAKVMVSLPSGTKIRSHGFYLLGFTGYTGSPAADIKWTAYNIGSSGGHIFVTNSSTAPKNAASTNVVDFVGYGTAKACEGTATSAGACTSPAPAPGTVSIERKANIASTAASLATGGTDAAAGNAEDTNNNKEDFVVSTARTPQNSASAQEP